MRHKYVELDQVEHNGNQAFVIRGTGLRLMKKNAATGSFAPVENLEKNVSSDLLDSHYGVCSRDQRVLDFKSFRRSERSTIVTSLAHKCRRVFDLEASKVMIRKGQPVLKLEWSVTDDVGHGARYWSPLAPAL